MTLFQKNGLRSVCLIVAVLQLYLFVFSLPAFSSRTDSDIFFQKAKTFLASGRYLEAMGLYQTVADMATALEEKARALVMIGATYTLYLDQHDMALKYFDYVLHTYPRTSAAGEALFKKGTVLYETRQYGAAYEIFSQYIANYPEGRQKNSAEVWAESAMNLAMATGSVDARWKAANQLADTTMRVLIIENQPAITLKSLYTITITDPSSGKTVASGPGTAKLTVKDGGIIINQTPTGKNRLTISTRNTYLKVDGTRYRGDIVVSASVQGLSAINHIYVEDYLYGVVPREVPYTWPKHALMAQAVAARTYALYVKEKRREEPYDVRATTASQVYGGYDAENPKTSIAVDCTRGQVMTYNGNLIVAYFHSNSGGYTECPENVWGAAVPYLKSTPDNYSNGSPGSTWEYYLPFSEASRRLNAYGIDVDGIKKLRFNDKSESGRVRDVTIFSDNGRYDIKGNNFRLAIGGTKLKSMCFNYDITKEGILFRGSGYGHGVGMSQWGARQMALEGYDYKSILKKYYSGIHIASLGGKPKK
ncbi:MAG: SpoIID/LytB domain-containing protein [Thermodesulfobacteriota bacterium]|nr:SpoIID/LytB domain-containing protein [Thermodesulfobacteriota bacterium]